MQKLGGMGGVLGMLPGVAKLKGQIPEANLDDKILKRQHAIITSMTPKERRNPKLLDGKRKRRIAAGSGTRVEEVNKLIKMHRQMADVMKMMGKNKGMMARMAGAMGMGGGPAPSEAEMARMREELARLDPKALEQLPPELKEAVKGAPKGLSGLGKSGGAAPPKLPGLGGGALPGLGGFPRFPANPGAKKK
jgi:signal recognition particle subunit SRP54